MDLGTVRRKLLTRHDLDVSGVGGRELQRRLARGEIRRLHLGAYVDAKEWSDAYAEERHLLHVLAVAAARRGSDAVVSHCSAAVLWQLPLFRMNPRRVHTSGSTTRGVVNALGDVSRHEVAVPAGDRDVRDGIVCTSLARTVFDVIRTVSEEAALSCADAAFRRVAWDAATRTYDTEAAAAFRSELEERIRRAAGARGIRRARRIVAMADGRAQLPGESVSRLYLALLGFEPPRLQVSVPGPRGSTYFVDFGLDDVPAWGEFDGTGKYTDPAMMAGVGYGPLAAEKEREDWIRGTTHRPFARWGMPHIASAATLGGRLAAFQISPRR